LELASHEPAHQRGWIKVGLLVGVVGLVGFAAGSAAFSGQGVTGITAALRGFEEKEERIKIVPSNPACSSPTDNCFETGCCIKSGHTCFVKSEKVGRCNATCTPGVHGFKCGVAANTGFSVPASGPKSTSLYCMSVYTKETGTKPNMELALLKAQHQFGASIFGCEAWDVFSDVSVSVGAGYSTVKVEDVYSEFHQVKRKHAGSWVNWALYYQAWVKVRELGKYQNMGWTVKVDPDAVFIPQRLRDWLHTRRDSPNGVYFENCKNVTYGFFGSMEVMSITAARVLTANLEECHAKFAPCANDGCDWEEHGSWGEDLFVQRCMDHHYVDKVETFDITTDGACITDRPANERTNKKWHAQDCSQVLSASVHPFKKPAEYLKCLGEIMQTTYD